MRDRIVDTSLSSPRKTILLAPPKGTRSGSFGSAVVDANGYETLLAELQRLRGRVYLEDGAITRSQLTSDGRHVMEADRRSWHVLSVSQEGICGCARLLMHDSAISYSDLAVRSSALANSREWGSKLRSAIEADIARARQKGIRFAEVSGWALDSSARCTAEALKIVLSTYSVSRLLGGCIGISTATFRHGSSIILQKIGGRMLEWSGATFPRYYDPQYKCEMSILRFESGSPNPRYEGWIEGLRSHLRTVPVICQTGVEAWRPEAARIVA